MTNVTKFDKPTLAMLRQSLDEALSAWGKTHGLKASLGNIKFDATVFESQVKVQIEGVVPQGLALMAKLDGVSLEANELGQVVDYNRKAHRTPWIYVRKADGKRYRTDPDTAKRMFPAAQAVPG